MANRYLSSALGLSSNTGLDTWGNGKVTLGDVAASEAVGDSIYVDPAHSETYASSVSCTFDGLDNQPIRLICAATNAAPPTTPSVGAVIQGAAAVVSLTMLGSVYAYGLTFRSGSSGAASLHINTGDEDVQVYDNCKLELASTSSSAKMNFGLMNTSNSAYTLMRNTNVKFSGISQYFTIYHKFRMLGGSLVGSAAINTLVSGIGASSLDARFDSVDLSAGSPTMNIALNDATLGGNIVLESCKMPDTWSGNLFATDLHFAGLKISMFNAKVGAGKILAWTQDGFGQCRSFSTTYRTGGFIDDSVPMAFKMTGTTTLSFPASRLEGVPCTVYVDSSGSPVTKYLEIVHDSQGAGTGGKLLDTEFGALIIHPGGFTEIVAANILGAGTAIPDSTATWTTPGMTTPIKQKLSLTFTPTTKGEIVVIPLLFVPKQVFYCPKLGT